MELLLLLIALGLGFLNYFLKSPRVIGAAGERRVNRMLRRKLDEQDYILLQNLTLPTTDGTTQIDHIVLSRFGIFVIETKNMSGWIFGDERQARWTQVLRSHRSQFQNPLRQNYLHLKVVEDLLGVEPDQLENLVAFVGAAEPKTDMPPNVLWSLRDLFDYIDSQKNLQFAEAEMQGFAAKLRGHALEGSNETRRAHVQHVREKATQKKNDSTKCPRCGAEMVERTNRKTGQVFWGCSRFPKCRSVRHVK